MTPEARAALLTRISEHIVVLQPLMRLAHWEIEVCEEQPSDRDALASCEPQPWVHLARIRIGDDFAKQTMDTQQRVIVHELLHIVTAEWQQAIEQSHNTLDPTSQGWARERCNGEMERAIDTLARIIAPFLPCLPAHDRVTMSETQQDGKGPSGQHVHEAPSRG